ncbi:MAG: alpha/beta fold hydrolase [Myxococcales bacterium]|nr:alpha/beta fold hydrolase [Myxococcales bacterium]
MVRAWMMGLVAVGVSFSTMACTAETDGIDEADDEINAQSATFRSEAELRTVEGKKSVVDAFTQSCQRGTLRATALPYRGGPYTLVYHRCPAKGPKRGAFAVVPGTTESSIRYAEFVADWTAKGYELFILNNRGEGFNARLLSDDPSTAADESQRRHMDSFDDYVSDLDDFVTKVVVPATPNEKRLMLVCHSMGGGICTRYAETRPNNPFKGLMLSAPMQGIKIGFFQRGLASVGGLALSESWVPGGGPYDPKEAFQGNVLTGSENRFALRHYVNQRFPEVQLGSPTYAWVRRAVEATEQIQRDASKITKPMLLLSALSDDIVDPKSHETVCNAMNGAKKTTCTRVPLQAEHEIFIERDEVRTEAFRQMLVFMGKVAPL